MHFPADPQLASRIERQPLSIASVTVAFNGAHILRQHLQALKNQSRSLDEIVVVDNASTDETRQLLATEFPDVTVLPLPRNVGIAGGLAAGLAYAALQQKHDWVWTFDQDSIPASDTLACLVAGLEHVPETDDSIAILAPLCAHPDTQTPYPSLRWQRWRFVPVEISANDPITFVDMVISSGSLVRQAAVQQAGLPRQDLFMDFVDYEYCLRLRQHGFRIAVVPKSTLQHAIGSPATFKFMGLQKRWADHAPWREYYITRNEIFTMWRYFPTMPAKIFVLRKIAQHAIGILLFGKEKLRCLRMIWRGFLDGRAGRLGIRFVPGVSEVRAAVSSSISRTELARKTP